MKNILASINLKRKYRLPEKIEFVVSTLLAIGILIVILTEAPDHYGELWGVNYLYHVLLLLCFYVAFLAINFVVIPNIEDKRSWPLSILIVVAIVALSFLFSPHYEDNAFLVILVCYFSVKHSLIFLWRRFRMFRKKRGSFSTGILVAFIFYALFIFLMFAGDAHLEAIVFPGILIPFSIGLYAYSFHNLIPLALRKKRPFWSYFWRAMLIVAISGIPLGLIGLLLSGDEELPMAIAAFNVPIQIFLTLPISWFVYKKYAKGKEEVDSLHRELGQSTAKFDFLRSQINPHFLFNVLNTLYGTAIQENAERTGEGIQRLGDMMRFMLHENVQEKISLQREIEYLENYINLQRLRTDASPEINIQATIQHQFDHAEISPMLLIPFVENAFKHGISFREASHIKISLEKKGNHLYFDVYNSKHLRQENDPEKDQSGIGLNNVRQRLEFLYPNRHDLQIRETSKEFFVHLTLQLS